MAFGFITTVTPLMMLGLAGAMPRYVERYRRAGHLNPFIQRILLARHSKRRSFRLYIGQSRLVRPAGVPTIHGAFCCCRLGFTTASVLVFNFINELMSSLRQVRTVSLMQFIQGVGFTALAIIVMGLDGNVAAIICPMPFQPY